MKTGVKFESPIVKTYINFEFFAVKTEVES